MQNALEMDLPFLDSGTPEFAADPYPHFAAARKKHPWLANTPFGLMLNEYGAIRDLFKDETRLENPYENMVSFMGAKNTPWGDFQENHLLNQTGEAHKRLRELLGPAFSPRQAMRHRPLMREVIGKLIDEWADRKEFDFELFASYFPITVMCRLIGADPNEIPPLRKSLEMLGLSASMDPRIVPELQKATLQIEDFSTRLVAKRRQEGPSGEEDLLDLMLEAQAAGGLSDKELGNILIFLFAAGYDTSKNILTLIMWEVIKRPDMYERCATDKGFCKKVIDETFRYHSTAGSMRVAGKDIVYRDVLIPKGTMVWLPINVIGRDLRVAERADVFDPDRQQKNPPMPFGLGVHICLGQFIARAQIEEGLHLITRRFKHASTSGPAGWRPFMGVWGIKGLPVRFEAA